MRAIAFHGKELEFRHDFALARDNCAGPSLKYRVMNGSFLSADRLLSHTSPRIA